MTACPQAASSPAKPVRGERAAVQSRPTRVRISISATLITLPFVD